MLRTGPWKYVYHTAPDTKHKSEIELYNLKTDPGEFNNLANKPEHRDLIRRLHAMLVEEVGEEPESIELRARADIANGYNRRQDLEKCVLGPKNYPPPRNRGDEDPNELRYTW